MVMELREEGFVVETDYLGRSVKAQMKYANKIHAKNTIIIGDNEVKENKGRLKNMETGENIHVSLDAVKEYL